MNQKVGIIFILAIAALGYLTYNTFGPSSNMHGPKANPESFKPIVSLNNESLESYHNRDAAENFYTISVPKSWQIQPPSKAGEYNFGFNDGTAKVDLMDVPDNSTLELFILSQDEPRLKILLNDFKRIDYQKLNISGNEAYQLVYLANENGIQFENVRTYISGPDQAVVITFSIPQSEVSSFKNTFDLVINSFSWENK